MQRKVLERIRNFLRNMGVGLSFLLIFGGVGTILTGITILQVIGGIMLVLAFLAPFLLSTKEDSEKYREARAAQERARMSAQAELTADAVVRKIEEKNRGA